MKTIISNFQLNARRAPADADAAAGMLAAKNIGLPPDAVRCCTILWRSIDSRRRDPVLVYKLLLDVEERFASGLVPASRETLEALGKSKLELPESRLRHPLVVGTGPAGIFGALVLAMAGCRPVVLDRGAMVEDRCRDHERFIRTRELDEESNLLIGEGGAGTFSDGKLYTGTHDPRGRFVIETLVESGAPPEIRFHSRPHIGSDYLRMTCSALRRRIIDLGGEFRFHARIREVTAKSGRFSGVRLASGEFIEAPAVLLAPGLGGRDLIRALSSQWGGAVPKPFQIGCRIEHPQELIDTRQYHGSRPECLGAAEYHLAFGGVSSFCMCPGGTLVNASAWRGQSCTNGMSLHSRDGEFANAALITTLPPEEFSGVENTFEFLGKLGAATFMRGGGNYAFPAQDAAGFLSGAKRLSRRKGSSETGMIPGRLDDLLPERVRQALCRALRNFDRKIPGFIRLGVLVGIESCVSSPLRMLRTADGEWEAMPGVYPAGEGVGAAGGIVSAACDGIRCAEGMLRRHR